MLKLAVFLTLVTASLQQCLTPDDSKFNPGRDDRQALFLGEQAFSVALLKEMAKARPAENVFFSPYSTHQALLLAFFGAANRTEASLRTALRIPPNQVRSRGGSRRVTSASLRRLDDLPDAFQDKQATWQAYRLEKFLRTFNASDAYTFKSSNRIYVSDKLKLRQCLAEKFDTEVATIDYATDVGAAERTINAWVEEQTKGQIKDLIQGLSADSTVTLVSLASPSPSTLAPVSGLTPVLPRRSTPPTSRASGSRSSSRRTPAKRSSTSPTPSRRSST